MSKSVQMHKTLFAYSTRKKEKRRNFMSKAPADAIAAKGGSKWHNTLVYLLQH